MATSIPLGGHGTFFVGEDKTFRLECLDADVSGVPVNMEGWAVVFDVRASDSSATPLFSVPATIIGAYSATRTENTQRAEVSVTDEQTGQLNGTLRYRYSWKRLDADRETLLAIGYLIVERATQV